MNFSGTSGGSCWILAINILAFRCLQARFGHSVPGPATGGVPAAWLAALLIIPWQYPWALKPPAKKDSADTAATGTAHNIVIVQPNIDPWDEKFRRGQTGGPAAEAHPAQRIENRQRHRAGGLAGNGPFPSPSMRMR